MSAPVRTKGGFGPTSKFDFHQPSQQLHRRTAADDAAASVAAPFFRLDASAGISDVSFGSEQLPAVISLPASTSNATFLKKRLGGAGQMEDASVTQLLQELELARCHFLDDTAERKLREHSENR
jgi:hypothetical protein